MRGSLNVDLPTTLFPKSTLPRIPDNYFNCWNIISMTKWKKIAEEKLEGYAAIASKLASEHYKLEILEEGIEDDSSISWFLHLIMA